MFINAATDRALEHIASRASDVYKAFTPGAVASSGDVMTERAASRPVLDPLSVTAPANDYFVTSDERGRTAYTRDGRLRVVNGTVVGTNGRAMLGYARDGEPLEALHVDPVDAALGRSQNLRVEPDGSIAYDRRAIEPRSGREQVQRVCIGRLALARFPAATSLTPADQSSFTSPPGTVPHLGIPGDTNFGLLSPMHREESRIDLNRSLDRLHDAYIAFDALQAVHKAQGATGKVAMDLLK